MALGIILEHMQCSFQNVKQKKKDKENILQDKFNKAKQTFECDPTNKNASDFNTRVLKRGGGGVPVPFPSPFFFQISLPSAQIPFPLAGFGKNPSVIHTTSFRFASAKLRLLNTTQQRPKNSQGFTKMF